MNPDELNAALQIAGQRLLEADRAYREAHKAMCDAKARLGHCQDDAQTLLRVLRDLTGGHGKQSIPLINPDPLADRERRVTVHISGHKGPRKKAAAICRRLCEQAGGESMQDTPHQSTLDGVQIGAGPWDGADRQARLDAPERRDGP